MKLQKTFFGITAIIFGSLTTWFIITAPDIALLPIASLLFAITCLKRPLWGLSLLIFLPIAGEFSRFSFLGRSIVLSDLFIPIFEFVIFWRLTKRPLDKNIQTPLKVLAAFLCVAIFSLLFSLTVLPFSEFAQSGLYLFRLIVYIGLLPCSYWLISKENYQQILKYIIISTLLIAATGFIQLQLLPNLEELAKTAGYDPHINRLVGSWLDPNFIGGFFAFMSLIISSIAIYDKSKKRRYFLLGIAAILLIALFLTYSRSAYLAFAVGLLVMGIIKARKLLIIVMIIATIGIASSERAQQRIGELATSMTSVLFNSSENPDPTARLRIKNWEQTLNLISQKPLLGHGYNTLTYIKLKEGFVQDEDVHSASGSDSSLLTILATTGIFGIFFFLIFYFIVLKKLFQTWKKRKPKFIKGLSLGLFSGIIALLIHSNFVNSLLFPQIMIFLFILLGLFYKTINLKDKELKLKTKKQSR
jgi:O-antigen ligase